MTSATESRAGRLLRHTRNNLDLPWAWLSSAATARADRAHFGDVDRFCLFVGYPRSGHSLVGSLLDAHPDAVIAHELDALRLVQVGFGRDQLFSSILRNSRAYGDHRKHVYDYTVPNQWQGRFRRIQVIGDKKGGRSTRRLADVPSLLNRLQGTVGVPVRFIHVTRNPFDNIATMLRRAAPGTALADVVQSYLALCATIATVKERAPAGSLLDIAHETLLAEPPAVMERLCRFLDLDPEPGYVKDCASILYSSPNRTREAVEWPREDRARVEEAIGRFEFLGHYSFAS